MYEVDIAPSGNTVRCMEGVCCNIIHINIYEIDLDGPIVQWGLCKNT